MKKKTLGPCPMCGRRCTVWRRRHFFLVGCMNKQCDYEGPTAFSIPEAIEYWEQHMINLVMEM